MPRITKVYTRTGDDGTTALGGGQRLPKDAARIEAYGTVDELNSVIGVALVCGLESRLDFMLRRIQNELFHLGSDLCILEEDKEKMPVPQIEAKHVEMLEDEIDFLQKDLEPLTNFILPGGSPGAAQLHVARTVSRRAERRLVTLSRDEPVGAHTLEYLNRLSDLLFVMSRIENRDKQVPVVTQVSAHAESTTGSPSDFEAPSILVDRVRVVSPRESEPLSARHGSGGSRPPSPPLDPPAQLGGDRWISRPSRARNRGRLHASKPTKRISPASSSRWWLVQPSARSSTSRAPPLACDLRTCISSRKVSFEQSPTSQRLSLRRAMPRRTSAGTKRLLGTRLVCATRRFFSPT
jgi:cob(I)alamin adenosyltransferase